MKRRMQLAALLTAIAMPVVSSAAWSDETYTTTTNGVTWTYKVDVSANKLLLGGGTTSNSSKMVDTAMAGLLYIPVTLIHDGKVYNATDYGYGALADCVNLTGIVFPETTFAQTAQGAALFQRVKGCYAIWWKGPETVASGTQPKSTVGGNTQLFIASTKLRAVVLGPNVTFRYRNDKYPLFKECSGVKAFFPKTYWADVPETAFGTSDNCKRILYGPGEDIDVSIDGTFTVTTAERLDDVLSVADYLRTCCGMSPKINVTQAIEFTEGLITSERLASATFNSLMFKTSTQAELDAILDAVPSSVPLAIDPTGAKVPLTIPSDRKVWVLLSGEGKFLPKVNGTVVSLH